MKLKKNFCNWPHLDSSLAGRGCSAASLAFCLFNKNWVRPFSVLFRSSAGVEFSYLGNFSSTFEFPRSWLNIWLLKEGRRLEAVQSRGDANKTFASEWNYWKWMLVCVVVTVYVYLHFSMSMCPCLVKRKQRYWTSLSWMGYFPALAMAMATGCAKPVSECWTVLTCSYIHMQIQLHSFALTKQFS